MKSVIVLNTESEGSEAHTLKNYLRGRMPTLADLRGIIDILAEDLDFEKQFHRSDCVLLIGSHQASSLIQNKQQETESDYITFDGKFIHEQLTENKELVRDKLVMVFLTERNESDWIPNGLDQKRIFDLHNEKIHRGNPALSHLEYTIRRVLGETMVDWWRDIVSSSHGRRQLPLVLVELEHLVNVIETAKESVLIVRLS